MSKQCNLGTVPNGSGSNGEVEARPGRRPTMDDASLQAHVAMMASEQGGLPTLDAIIESVGGCQRSRAVVARKEVAQKLAVGELGSYLKIPSTVEMQLRKLLVDWLQHARNQLEPILAEVVESAEERVSVAEQAAQDARSNMEAADSQIVKLQKIHNAAEEDFQKLERRLAKVTAAECKWRALAQERALVLRELMDKQ